MSLVNKGEGNMKKVIIIFLLMAVMMTTGCSIKYQLPVNLMKTPKLNEKYIKNQQGLTDSEMRVLAQSFVPNGYKILEDTNSMEKQSIYYIDVDGDSKQELVVLVKNSTKINVGFFIMKDKYGKWEKTFEFFDEGVGVKTVKAISGDNGEEGKLLVSNMTSFKGPNQYYLFDFSKGWDTNAVDLGLWTALTIIPSESGQVAFVAQNNENDTISDLYVVRYDGENFYNYVNYDVYESKIAQYKNIIDQYEGNESVWYYYIYSKYMIKKYDEALKDMDEYWKRNRTGDKITVKEDKFKILNAIILIELGQVDKAKDIIEKTYGPMVDNGDKDYDISWWDFYYAMGKISILRENREAAAGNFEMALRILNHTYDKDLKGYGKIVRDVKESMIKEVTK